jgi:acyl-[acyl carrier protein]--UDP-N-acetylglucosamine O-acyltransferase
MTCEFCGRACGPGSRGTCDRCTSGGPNGDPTAVIGRPPEHRDHPAGTPGIVPEIDPEARIEALCTVDAGLKQATRIGKAWLMKGVHIGHDAQIGDGCELAPHCSVGGHVVLGTGVRVGQGANFKPFVSVGDGARIGMGAVVIRDVPAGEVWAGSPARKLR